MPHQAAPASAESSVVRAAWRSICSTMSRIGARGPPQPRSQRRPPRPRRGAGSNTAAAMPPAAMMAAASGILRRVRGVRAIRARPLSGFRFLPMSRNVSPRPGSFQFLSCAHERERHLAGRPFASARPCRAVPRVLGRFDRRLRRGAAVRAPDGGRGAPLDDGGGVQRRVRALPVPTGTQHREFRGGVRRALRRRARRRARARSACSARRCWSSWFWARSMPASARSRRCNARLPGSLRRPPA